MNLYYHHVGQIGSSADFPKTVFSQVDMQLVEKNISHQVPECARILSGLRSTFLSGQFNCWGVPSGARNVIRNLRKDDGVLLIETTAGDGMLPALALVKAYWNVELRDLSMALWGNHKFPYIFFFDTQRLNLTWTHFIEHVGYKSNYRPSGNFLSIKPERLEKFGGPASYVQYILDKYALQKTANKINERASPYETNLPIALDKSMPDQLDDLEYLRDTYKAIERTEMKAIVKSRIGQGRFRKALIEYWRGCAVTGCEETSILRASHIKPWRESTNEERLNPYNGLLLLPNLDALFDRGWISFTDEGIMLISSHITRTDMGILGLETELKIDRLAQPHFKFLDFHRNHVFKA